MKFLGLKWEQVRNFILSSAWLGIQFRICMRFRFCHGAILISPPPSFWSAPALSQRYSPAGTKRSRRAAPAAAAATSERALPQARRPVWSDGDLSWLIGRRRWRRNFCAKIYLATKNGSVAVCVLPEGYFRIEASLWPTKLFRKIKSGKYFDHLKRVHALSLATGGVYWQSSKIEILIELEKHGVRQIYVLMWKFWILKSSESTLRDKLINFNFYRVM